MQLPAAQPIVHGWSTHPVRVALHVRAVLPLHVFSPVAHVGVPQLAPVPAAHNSGLMQVATFDPMPSDEQEYLSAPTQ